MSSIEYLSGALAPELIQVCPDIVNSVARGCCLLASQTLQPRRYVAVPAGAKMPERLDTARRLQHSRIAKDNVA